MSTQHATNPRPLAAVILAAGKGTRMRSDLPKVCHTVASVPMVRIVHDACKDAGCDPVVAVVGYKQDLVREALADTDARFAVQDEQLGTGHAVACTADILRDFPGDVLILCGDGPLIRARTLRTLVDRHRRTDAACTLATSVIDDPTGYGRIVRDESGAFVGIVEQKNATPEQLAICEVNPSYYCFRAADLFEFLPRLTRNERTGEYYITDLPALLMQASRRVEVIDAVDPQDVLSINTPEDLSRVEQVYLARQASPRAASGDAT